MGEAAFTVELLPESIKQISRLPKPQRSNIVSRIEALAQDPRPRMSKPLKGMRGVWRMRVGDYRVLYGIDDQARKVVVTQVGNRKDVYRGL